MYNFTLNIPTKIMFGADHRKVLPSTVLAYGKRVLLVYGGNAIKNIGLYDEIVNALNDVGAELFELSGVKSNPRHEKVDEGAKICRENKIEVILAIGGGSVIDCAKAISVTAESGAKCWNIITKKVTVDSAIPVITVLTVAGTGSEMNNSCVISNEELKIKRGFSNDLLFPKASFLDPLLTYSVSPFQTACGCADTLSHVLDTAYLMPGDRMDMLCMVMESVSKTVIKYGPIAVNEPSNYEARANLMWASTFALNGILKNGIRQPAVCHIIEHELSAYYDINHGLGMAVILPRWMRYVLDDENEAIFARYGREVFGIAEADDLNCAKKTSDALEDFMYNKLGLPSCLGDCTDADKDLEELAQNVCWGGSVGGIKELKPSDIVNILKMCF